MPFKRGSSVLQTEKHWLSIPFHIRKYHHLWNLLNRSTTYASALLSLIQSKEKQKKRKLLKKQKQNLNQLKTIKNDYSLENDAMFVLEKLVAKVVMAVQLDCSETNLLSNEETSDDEKDNSICHLSPIAIEESFSSCANQSSADSALAESSFFSENQSCKFDVNDSCSSKLEDEFWCENNDSLNLLSDTDDNDVVSDCSYVQSIKERRQKNTSPQSQTTLLTNLSIPNQSENKNVDVENVNWVPAADYFSTAKLDCKPSSKTLLPIEVSNETSLDTKLTSDLKLSKTTDHCSLEVQSSDRNLTSLSESSDILNTSTDAEKNLGFCKNPIYVFCPICNKKMSEKNINLHLDACTETTSKRKSLRSSNFEHCTAEIKTEDSAMMTRLKKHELKKDEISLGKKESTDSTNLQRSNVSSKPLLRKRIKKESGDNDLLSKKINKESSDNDLLGKEIKKESSDNDLLGKEIKKELSDNDVGFPVTFKGVEKLKAALQGAIARSDAVKDLVLQSAIADENFLKSKLESSDGNSFMKALKESPIFSDASSKFKLRVNSEKNPIDSSDSDSDVGEDSIDTISSSVPSRRSSRVKASKKFYCEISDDDDDDDDFYCYIEETVVPKKRIKKEPVTTANDTDPNEADFNDKTKEIDAASREFQDDDCEIENVGFSKEEIDCLMAKKLYLPEHNVSLFLPEDQSGVRYFNEEPVDLAQPKYFTGGALREYQIAGFQWLKLMHEIGVSGILADEMGLGKTIQCIALICKFVKSGEKGPFLVSGPTSTIDNWKSEFKKFAPKVPVLLYHGTSTERLMLKQKLMEMVKSSQEIVVITSYEILLRDKGALQSFCWSYWILDEGHRVKNLHSKTFRVLQDFPSSSKLMLTGTPLQNNVSELWSLLNFILPEVFDDIQAFDAWFGIESLQQNEKLLAMLHQILTPFVLRRVKSDVEVKIPPKREILVSAPLGSLQEKYYCATVDKSIVHLIKNKEYYDVTPGVANPELGCLSEENNTDERRLTRSKLRDRNPKKDDYDDNEYGIHITLNNMMMQLRRCCNHPYLIHFPLEYGTEDLLVDESIVTTCGKMMLIDKMLPVLKKDGHKVLIFSQMTSMLNILEDYCNFRQYSFVRFDGSTKCEERYKSIKKFNDDHSVFIFLLSTRAGGLGINLTAADTVIIYDSDWNPHNDLQAQDRCHRIGQKKAVLVYRLVSMGTIDQKIVERAATKRKLERIIMHQKKFKGCLASELNNSSINSSEELLRILESKSNINVVDNKDNVISDSDLQQLLDRSVMVSKPIDVSLSKSSPFQPSTAATFQIIDEVAETSVCA